MKSDGAKEAFGDANLARTAGEHSEAVTSPEKQQEPGAVELLELIKRCVQERKGRDLVVLNLKELTSITDYFVICSGSSSMHTRSVSEHVEQVLKKAGARPLGVEGLEGAKWILMDYGEIVVHIFLDETRWFYNLERLWGDAQRVLTESE